MLGRTRTLASMGDELLPASPPHNARSPSVGLRGASRGGSLHSLVHVCVNEAFTTVFTGIEDELLALLANSKARHLRDWLLRSWPAPAPSGALSGAEEALPTETFQAQARRLDVVTRTLEAYDPRSHRFREVRAKVKQMMLALELMDLQIQSLKPLTLA